MNLPGTGATCLIGKVREILARRAGGVSTLRTLGKQFKVEISLNEPNSILKIMDRSGDGSVSREELRIAFDKFCRGYGLVLTPQQVDKLFDVSVLSCRFNSIV